MSEIKGYTVEEVARDAKEKLISDYERCKCDLAEWLEELKAYRANEGMSENVYRCGYKFGYNKAVDDTIKSIKKEYAFTILEEEKIDEIAKQLKKASDSE